MHELFCPESARMITDKEVLSARAKRRICDFAGALRVRLVKIFAVDPRESAAKRI